MLPLWPLILNQWHTQEFFWVGEWKGVQQIQLRTEDRENLKFSTRNLISYSKIFLIFGTLRLFLMTTNLFVIANVKQLWTRSSFRILLPFFWTPWGVDILNSAVFNSFYNRVEFGTILEGLQNFEGGSWNPHPRYDTVLNYLFFTGWQCQRSSWRMCARAQYTKWTKLSTGLSVWIWSWRLDNCYWGNSIGINKQLVTGSLWINISLFHITLIFII